MNSDNATNKPNTTADVPPKTKDNKKPTPIAKKKRSWWKFYLFCILMACLFIVFQYPDKIEHYANVEIPAPIKKSIAFIKKHSNWDGDGDKQAVESASKPTPAPVPTKPSVAIEPTPETSPTTYKPTIIVDDNKDDNKGDEMMIAPIQIIDSSSNITLNNTTPTHSDSPPTLPVLADSTDNNITKKRLTQIEVQYNELARNLQAINHRQTTNNNNALYWQLQIIDLNLQLNGDTKKTAQQIDSLISTTPSSLIPTLQKESIRLKNMPSRQTVLFHIQALKEATKRPANTNTEQENTAWYVDNFKTLFKFKENGISSTAKIKDESFYALLDDMEHSLLSRQYDIYSDALQALQKHDNTLKIDIQQLVQYGAVSYQLTFPINLN